MDPYQFGVLQTVEFIKRNLPSSDKTQLLEVGAGRGRLTARLVEMGFDVDAIDKSKDAVSAAKEVGVSVMEADITAFQTPKQYDGIIFCMSAHHVFPLSKALDRARTILRPNGVLIFEEYAVEDADEFTARWYEQTRALATSLNLFAPDEDEPLLNLNDPLGAWRKEHFSNEDHHFNTGAEMVSEIKQRFEVLKISRGPYFYRYLAPRFAEKVPERNLSERLCKLEETLIATKQIRPLGLRIVAKGN